MKLILTFLLAFFAIFPYNSFAKENKDLIKANYYYSHYAYNEAIPFLEKLSVDATTSDIFTKLGDCYRLTGNIEKAATAYGKATSIGKCTDITYLNYGLVLMKLTRYDDAEKEFRKYGEKNKKDNRVNSLISSCSSAALKIKEMPSGIAALAPFNSDGSDFAPTLWNGNLVFTSDTVIDTRKSTDKWSGNAYCGIYSIPIEGAGKYGSIISMVQGSKDLNIKYHTGPCTFAAKGKEMYYTRSKYNSAFLARKAVTAQDSAVLLEIMIASDYNEAEKKFKNITPFPYNSDDYSVANPTVSPNGNIMVFSSDMPRGTGRRDLYLCKKAGKERWAKPVSLGITINTEGDEAFPWWADDTTLFFSSDGHEGLGGLDIFRTRWDFVTGKFSKPENLPLPLNSPYDDISLAVPPDAGSCYFSSDRPASKGGDNIYYYKKEKVFLQINVTDSITKQPVANVKLAISTPKENTDTITDNLGRLFMRLYPEAQYRLNISSGEYEPKYITVNATTEKENDTILRSVVLARKEKPRQDTVAALITEQVVIRNKNVMDSPGIRDFTLNEIYEVGDFYYDYNKYELTGVHKRYLDTLMIQLNRHKTMRLEIQAHTDCRGTVASNQVLSNNRALSVVNYLTKHGISRKRIEYIGLGSSKPKVNCPDCNSCTEEDHHLNRILEFKVLQL